MIKSSNKIYITYLKSNQSFNHNNIQTNLKSICFKPKYAFWGSPINAKYGWRDWCIDEDFGDYNFNNPIKWKLKEDSKVLFINMDAVINPNTILNKYIIIDKSIFNLSYELNFKKMRNEGIDAVELLDANIGHEFINKLEMGFNGWDCESIVVLNPSKIIFI